MIDFKKIEITDKNWMDPLIRASNIGGCHQNFTNLFTWGEIYTERAARIGDYAVVKIGAQEDSSYFFPTGTGDIKPVLDAILADAKAGGHPLRFGGISVQDIAVLDLYYPGKFTYEHTRDEDDYMYLAESLATLAGKKLHSKRNHLNRFIENNPDWRFEAITKENIADAWAMNVEWCKVNGCSGDEELQNEACAVYKSFENFEVLGLEGGLIRAGGKVVAYTMGEMLNSDTYVVHIEKAFGEIQGAYPIINRQFVQMVLEKHPEVIYINREEDVGQEGLRKAKLSYYPAKMWEKYVGTYNE